jgi:hypothetical protein
MAGASKLSNGLKLTDRRVELFNLICDCMLISCTTYPTDHQDLPAG